MLGGGAATASEEVDAAVEQLIDVLGHLLRGVVKYRFAVPEDGQPGVRFYKYIFISMLAQLTADFDQLLYPGPTVAADDVSTCMSEFLGNLLRADAHEGAVLAPGVFFEGK